MRLIKQAPIYFRMDKDAVLKWAKRELEVIQSDEQLLLFKGEE